MGIPLSTLVMLAEHSVTVKPRDSSELCRSLWLRLGTKWYLLLVTLYYVFKL